MSEKYPETLLNIALIEPEIPNNTGNIGRTCVGLWSKLHVVGPTPFEITDKNVKRAGLDYWPHLDMEIYDNWNQFSEILPDPEHVFLIETGSDKSIYDVEFQKGDFLLFGKETKGLPAHVLEKYQDRKFSIPFPGQLRSFNLANAVAMCMSEAHRQFLA